MKNVSYHYLYLLFKETEKIIREITVTEMLSLLNEEPNIPTSNNSFNSSNINSLNNSWTITFSPNNSINDQLNSSNSPYSSPNILTNDSHDNCSFYDGSNYMNNNNSTNNVPNFSLYMINDDGLTKKSKGNNSTYEWPNSPNNSPHNSPNTLTNDNLDMPNCTFYDGNNYMNNHNSTTSKVPNFSLYMINDDGLKKKKKSNNSSNECPYSPNNSHNNNSPYNSPNNSLNNGFLNTTFGYNLKNTLSQSLPNSPRVDYFPVSPTPSHESSNYESDASAAIQIQPLQQRPPRTRQNKTTAPNIAHWLARQVNP